MCFNCFHDELKLFPFQLEGQAAFQGQPVQNGARLGKPQAILRFGICSQERNLTEVWSVAWVLCMAKPKLPSLRWMLLLLDSGLEDKLLPLINDVPSTEPLPGRDRAVSGSS